MVFLKLYVALLAKKMSSIKLGSVKSFVGLNISVISNCTFFGVLSQIYLFLMMIQSWKYGCSLYVQFVRLFHAVYWSCYSLFLLWNIHTKGQYWNWLVTIALIKSSLKLSVARYVDMPYKANSLLPAFLQVLLTCFSKLRFAAIKTP